MLLSVRVHAENSEVYVSMADDLEPVKVERRKQVQVPSFHFPAVWGPSAMNTLQQLVCALVMALSIRFLKLILRGN